MNTGRPVGVHVELLWDARRSHRRSATHVTGSRDAQESRDAQGSRDALLRGRVTLRGPWC